MVVDVEKLTDAELRTKLLEFGFPVMPITGTTRKVMAKKLKMLLENKNKIGGEGRRYMFYTLVLCYLIQFVYLI